MKLTELQNSYKTDKGTAHNYLTVYDSLFEKIKNLNINLLEIGVLFGESLKLFSAYFPKGNIYGIENFSQDNGHSFHNYRPVIKSEVIADLKKYPAVTLFDFNCEDSIAIEKNLNNLKFDIIIDDGSHELDQQIKNIKNYSKYMNNNGIYICEDIRSRYNADALLQEAKTIFPTKKCYVLELNVAVRADDILLIVE